MSVDVTMEDLKKPSDTSNLKVIPAKTSKEYLSQKYQVIRGNNVLSSSFSAPVQKDQYRDSLRKKCDQMLRSNSAVLEKRMNKTLPVGAFRTFPMKKDGTRDNVKTDRKGDICFEIIV